MKIAFMYSISKDDKELLKKGQLGNYFLMNLLPCFINAGHSIVLISLDEKKEVCCLNNHLKVYFVKKGRHGNLSALFGFRYEVNMIAKILKKENCDIFHAHWCYEYAKAALKVDATKTLITLHDWPDVVCPMIGNYYWKKHQRLGNKVLEESTNVTAVSPYIKELYDIRFPDKKATIVTNFMNPIEYNSIVRKESEFIIISINNEFSKRKNTGCLMKAFSKVKKLIPEAKLYLCGDGYESAGSAYNWAKKENILSGIEFVGNKSRKEIMSLLEIADIMVHPSLEESFGMTLIESMYVKTYVIAGVNSGAVPWVLGNGKYGKLIDVSDENKIAEAIIAAYNNGNEVETVVEKAYKYVKATFSVESIAQKYMKEYLKVQS